MGEIRKPGDVVLSGYWQQTYKVLAVAGRTLRVRWEDGRVTTHCTPMGSRDRVLVRSGR